MIHMLGSKKGLVAYVLKRMFKAILHTTVMFTDKTVSVYVQALFLFRNVCFVKNTKLKAWQTTLKWYY